MRLQGAQVWRVEWNVTGTVLSSSGDDGKVRLWKGALACALACRGVHAVSVRGGVSRGPP